MEYMHLIGAQGVEQAGLNIEGAAESFRQTCAWLQEDMRALTQALQEHTEALRTAHEHGANWMRSAILASLRGYPDAGGDAEIMAEVERIRRLPALSERVL